MSNPKRQLCDLKKLGSTSNFLKKQPRGQDWATLGKTWACPWQDWARLG
jgi:hypothetical protein